MEYSQYIEKLSKGGATISGLDIENVLDNFIKIKHPNTNKLTKIDLQNFIKSMKDSLRTKFTLTIAKLNNLYHQILEIIKSVGKTVARIVANMIVPAVVAVPPAINNPIHLAVDVAIKVDTLLTTLNTATGLFLLMFEYSDEIGFTLPKTVLDLIDILATTKNNVNKITDKLPI